MALADGRARRNADDDVGEVATGRVPHPQPPERHALAKRLDSAARRLDLVHRSLVHEDVDVPADEPPGSCENENGDEERGDRVASRIPGAGGERAPGAPRSSPPGRRRSEARWRRTPGSRTAGPRGATRPRGWHRSEITTQITRSAYHVASTSDVPSTSRWIASAAISSETSTRKDASARAARCSAFPWP